MTTLENWAKERLKLVSFYAVIFTLAGCVVTVTFDGIKGMFALQDALMVYAVARMKKIVGRDSTNASAVLTHWGPNWLTSFNSAIQILSASIAQSPPGKPLEFSIILAEAQNLVESYTKLDDTIFKEQFELFQNHADMCKLMSKCDDWKAAKCGKSGVFGVFLPLHQFLEIQSRPCPCGCR